MPILAPDPQVHTTTAQRRAQEIWSSNRRALSRSQPAVAELLNDVALDVEWVFARDGSVTARENGRWWADCSVPVLAGRTLLRTLPDEPIGSCQLAPSHAGLVQAARERMGNCPVLFVAQPDARIARTIMSTHDFSNQIDRRRFWITAGAEWVTHFETMFTDNPGLATPLRFIRTRLTSEEITLPMINQIQSVFSRVLAQRSEEVARIRNEPATPIDPKNILIVGETEFRLWDFGTRVVEQEIRTRATSDGLHIDRFDMDDALSGSPLALLQAARHCGCVVAADVCRADCNQLVSPDIAWITWMTQPGAPPFDTAGPRDSLILADEKWRPIARVAGWPADRVRVCGWPVNPIDAAARLSIKNELGFICDTRKIQIPLSIADFSSHRLLWELIEEELNANPLAIEDVDGYLSNRAGQLNIAGDVLDRPRFIEELILPAYQQGMARLLISSGVPIRIWGNGWSDLPEFAARNNGAISDQRQFELAVNQSCGLVFAWPTRAAHAIELTGKPIVYRTGMDRSAFVREARRVIATPSKASIPVDGDRLANVILELTRA